MINNVSIMGRLTADPEINYTNNEILVCNFSIACDRAARKGKEKLTDFFECVAWRSKAEFLGKYFRKGDTAVIVGKLFTETFVDKNNNKRTAVKILVNEIHFAGGKNNRKDDIPPGLEEMNNVTDEEEDGDLPF